MFQGDIQNTMLGVHINSSILIQEIIQFSFFSSVTHLSYGTVSAAAGTSCSCIFHDEWAAHIAVDGTQYVRWRKAITIRYRENCPIPHDTTDE